MIQKRVAHYRILEELGAGGMGRVYLAEDTRLGRKVAIKFLPAECTRDEARLRRFEREARAASALNHPNILTIHETGEWEGERFIVSEFVEGETLRARLARGRPTVLEAIALSIQVAEALAAAHRAGIVHRDIKPENIMIRTDGYAKVLDFGLAKLTGGEPAVSPDAPTLERFETEPGTAMGTVSYMSPEQARGIGVDARTDLFSLGVVLYEMLSGRLPFRGRTSTEVILAILQEEPAPVVSVAPAVPAELGRIVGTALAKDPDSRYGTAGELAADLRRLEERLKSGEQHVPTDRIAPTAPGLAIPALRSRGVWAVAIILLLLAAGAAGIYLTQRNSGDSIDSLAVLPFENASRDADGEYLSEGIPESLINDLSRLPGLKVMSRNAVWRYKRSDGDAPIDARATGKALGVQAILTGRVARRGEDIAISVELIDARDERQIWGEQFERGRGEILAVQNEIVAGILETLRMDPSGDERRLLEKRHTEDSEAWDRYIRGRYHLNRRSADAIRKGREFFQQAIEKDPAYALAYAGVSDAYALLAAQGAMAPGEAYPAALASARRAIELDPGLAEGHASLAHAAFHTGDAETAEREFARAIALDPSYGSSYQWQSEYLASSGRTEAAFVSVKKALALDPLDLAANAYLGALLLRARRYREAEAQMKKTLEIDPSFFNAHAILGSVYLETGELDQAIREFQETSRLTGGSRGEGGLGLAYATAGRADEARRLLAMMEARAKTEYVTPLEVARIYAALKDPEGTLRWLERARAENPGSPRPIGNAKEYDFLRSDPRFIALSSGP